MDKLADFLKNENGQYSELADLPLWWDAIPPDTRDPNHSNYLMRDIMIFSYMNWSFTKPWAWEGLKRLLNTLLERGEPIPEPLQKWANCFASGKRIPPNKRGRKENSERDARIMAAYRAFRANEYSSEKAMEIIADAIHLSPEAVKSVFQKVKKDRPFQG